MGSNTLIAIKNVVTSPIEELKSFYEIRNRANNMGDALENYIKDIFAGTLHETNEQNRLIRLKEVFSYTGSRNNPPDMIVRNSDAIEVKKIESTGAELSFNSSYPKAKLLVGNTKINEECRTCEDWQEKDILYAVGVVKGNHLKKLFFVYGIDYAASIETYERPLDIISNAVNTIPGKEFSPTNEIARLNRIDPLGITNLRMREMWIIKNPSKVFSYVYSPRKTDFELTAIINTEKYNSFPSEDRSALENLNSVEISDVEIKTPDYPEVLKPAKMIRFSR